MEIEVNIRPVIWIGSTHKRFEQKYNICEENKRYEDEEVDVGIGNGADNGDDIIIDNDSDIWPSHCHLLKHPDHYLSISDDINKDLADYFGVFHRIRQGEFAPLLLYQEFLIGKQRFEIIRNEHNEYKLHNHTNKDIYPLPIKLENFTIGKQ